MLSGCESNKMRGNSGTCNLLLENSLALRHFPYLPYFDTSILVALQSLCDKKSALLIQDFSFLAPRPGHNPEQIQRLSLFSIEHHAMKLYMEVEV